ncbi:TPA: hypothetical protein HA251_05760 [Candidatus Woesearchaeota archaeon]|nr:hypothetical protein [Candidatus Woesearchaeota archaeon]
MDTVKGVLIILTILLAGASFLLYIQLAASESQLEKADAASVFVLQYLQAQNVPKCGADPKDYLTIAACVKPQLAQKDFKEDGFSPGDKKSGAGGYIIIKNVNRRSYESARFSFYKNRVLEQSGCTIPGTIDYNVACRFNFGTYCQDGDVLEILYTTNSTSAPAETKVFTKNC